MPSANILKEKESIVSDIIKEMNESLSVIMVDYRGLTVEQDTELRVALRKEGVSYKVLKNTLVTKAVQQMGNDAAVEYLSGPTAIAFCKNDYASGAKVICEFATKFKNLTVKGGIVDGNVIDEAGVDTLAKMPNKEELVGMVLRGFNAPITGFVNVLNGNIRGLVVALNAIAEKQSA